MPSIVGEQGSEADILEQAVKLEQDCLAAYTQAMQRLKDAQLSGEIGRLVADHRARLARLQRRLAETAMGQPSPNPLTAALNRGKVELGRLLGDRAILLAVRNNADDTALAYGQVAERVELSEPTRQMFRDMHQEARRHQAWFEALPSS